MQNELEITRPWLADYQKQLIYCPERFTITEAATKCGKTFSHLWWLFEEAAVSDKEGANFWWVAPVYPQAEIAFNRLRKVIKGTKHFTVNLSKLTVQCPNGAAIHFKSAEKPDNLYGEDVYAAVFDEFTRAREEAWYALRSTITATGGKIKLIGNAKGKKNWGYLLGVKARAGEPGYKYFRITAWDAVAAGIVEREEIEQAQRDLPESVFKELYLAEPQEDGTNPFGYDYIARAVKPISVLPAQYFGVDLAKRKDWTVIVGLDKNGDISFFKRFQSDWLATKREIIAAVGKNYAAIDSTGVGDPVVEEIQRECANVDGFNYSGGNKKQQLMEGLALSLQQGSLGIIDGIMKDELEAFEFEYSIRAVKYSAPSGFTDDCVNALALANHCKNNAPVIHKVSRPVVIGRRIRD